MCLGCQHVARSAGGACGRHGAHGGVEKSGLGLPGGGSRALRAGE